MKVTIKVTKLNESNGARLVQFDVQNDSDITNCCFKITENDNGDRRYELREIINGEFAVVEDCEDSKSYCKMYFSTDSEIDDFVKQIVDSYRKIKENLWQGEKTYEYEI